MYCFAVTQYHISSGILFNFYKKKLSSGFEKNKPRATTAEPPWNTILSPSRFLCFCWVFSTLNLIDNHQQSHILSLSYKSSVWLADKSFNIYIYFFFPLFFPPTKQHWKSTPKSEVLHEHCCSWRVSRHCWWSPSTEILQVCCLLRWSWLEPR